MASGVANLWLDDTAPLNALYRRLEAAGRLTRPKHWREFIPFAMANKPLKMSIDEAQIDVVAQKHDPQTGRLASPESTGGDALHVEMLNHRIEIIVQPLRVARGHHKIANGVDHGAAYLLLARAGTS